MKILLVLFILVTANLVAHSQNDVSSYAQTLSKMMEVSGQKATFKASISKMVDLIKQQKSEVPAETWTEFEQAFLSASHEELVTMLVPVYQKHLSEADLKNVIAFYQSPAGRKFAEKTPIITTECMQVGQQWGMKIAQQFMEKIKAKGY